MSQLQSDLLERLSWRPAPEAFTVENGPAFFETHDGTRTEGSATVTVTRATIAISFMTAGGLKVPRAGYGESHGRIISRDHSWSAPNVNDAGRTSETTHLFGTMELIVGRPTGARPAATRLWIAGADWSGHGNVDAMHVMARGVSGPVVSHHDRRMAIAFDGVIHVVEAETIGRCCSFVTGIDTEILAFEHLDAEGAVVQAHHLRGFRRLGRGPHSPFTGLTDDDRMRAFTALMSACPKLIAQGVPIDMILDQISAHNQVAQIHVSAPLLLMATLTAAYHHVHGLEVIEGAASRAAELEQLNRHLSLGLTGEDITRFERLRVELLEAGFFHRPGYETGRPQKDIKFIRDISHAVVLRLCGYTGAFYGAEKFAPRELRAADAHGG